MIASKKRLERIEQVAPATMIPATEVLILLEKIRDFWHGRNQMEIAEYVESWAVLLRSGDMCALDRRIAEWQWEQRVKV